MAGPLGSSAGVASLKKLVIQRIKREAHLQQYIDADPTSLEALVLTQEKKDMLVRDERKLQDLANLKEGIESQSNLNLLGPNEQIVIKGEHVSIIRSDSDEVLLKKKRRASTFVFELPSRKDAIAQLEELGLLKRIKGLPVVWVKRDDWFRAISKAIHKFNEKSQEASVNEA